MDKNQMLTAEREKVDAIDKKIVQLLEERMAAVAKIAEIKGQGQIEVLDNNREAKVLSQVASYVKMPAYQATIHNTFVDIMKNSRAFQQKQLEQTN
ncbi:chorismate mutase [Enterococcus sp. PF1-24]|uniref:chorismate mutase n=1 Tax=unclassified Enterococcus TaxID=2608891 RepID=UPI00247720F4|nr:MULTISPECIES: chorismate mutase [unclassified Enterococcus]MDH6363762.1 chorismate mutase [Enterococcus sp. PFB1-1]MDH6400718.1 chorismate mutase [Enterococcus sp. PF1-24]